jgi:hypothetical protein
LGLVLLFKNKMRRLIIILLCCVLFNSCDKEQAVEDQLSELPSWNCVNGVCVDPGDGSGQHSILSECEDNCSDTPSWDCNNGVCSDPGTGQGFYTSLSACQSNCFTGNSGLLVIEVNSECVPFRVEYEKTSSSNEIQELITNANNWSLSWTAQQGDRIYIKVKDPASGGQPGAGYPGGITKLVDIKILYKDEIIASVLKYFTHTNDGEYIYATVP